jgi:trehalose transport system permease protein
MRRLMRDAACAIMIALALAMLLFPLYVLFRTAFGTPEQVFAEKPPYFILRFTLGHFRDVFASGGAVLAPLRKSIVTALFASAAALLLSIPAAYAIARFDVRLRYLLVLLIFVTRMVPEISIALPVSIGFIRLGLFDTTAGLILAHIIRILPISCFILVSVFSSLPADLEKQARIDGANRITAITKVVLPLSLGGISVAGIFSFMLSWDEFIYASYLTLAGPTMPLKMYYYLSRGDVFSSATYATIITVPVLVMTFALQRYLRPDYLSGAIKG